MIEICKESTVKSNAVFSEDEKHRYLLTRVWNEDKPKATVIMLNPSYAAEVVGDYSSMRAINIILNKELLNKFDIKEEYGGIYIVNLFSVIQTDSKQISKEKCKANNLTDKYIIEAIKATQDIFIAWGTNSNRKTRIKQVIRLMSNYKVKSIYRIEEQDGQLKHLSKLSNNMRINKISIENILK